MIRDSGLSVPERYWGSYRPGVYFGMKTRAPKDVVTGRFYVFYPTKTEYFLISYKVDLTCRRHDVLRAQVRYPRRSGSPSLVRAGRQLGPVRLE